MFWWAYYGGYSWGYFLWADVWEEDEFYCCYYEGWDILLLVEDVVAYMSLYTRYTYYWDYSYTNTSAYINLIHFYSKICASILKFSNKNPNNTVLSTNESKSPTISAYIAKLLKKYTNTISAMAYILSAASVD